MSEEILEQTAEELEEEQQAVAEESSGEEILDEAKAKVKEDGDEEAEEVDQNFMGRAKILDTPYGKIVKNLIDEGAQLGVSSRGMGSLKSGKNGISEVQGDFYLATAADIVADPSAPDAFVAGIMEGKEWIWDNGLLKETQIQEYKDKIEKSSRKDRETALVEAFKDFIVKL